MKEYIVYGQKLGKSKPMIEAKTGKTIWGGVNRPVVLGRAVDEGMANMFLRNVRKTVGRTWKLWIEHT